MQIFVRVADAGSFAAAARQSQLAPSVVTRLVAALETKLQVKLLARSTRRLSLTSAGEAYLLACRDILERMDAAESLLANAQKHGHGRIRISLPVAFGLQTLVPALLRLAEQEPDLDLVIDLSDRRVNLIEDGFDLAIRITDRLEPGDVVRKLGQCRLMTVASPHYLSQRGTPQHPSELRQHDCLLYAQDGVQATWRFQQGQELTAVALRPRVVINSGQALADAAALGMGITRHPDFLLQSYLKEGRLVEVLANYPEAPLGIYAVLPGNRFIPHRVRRLVAELSSWVAQSTSVVAERKAKR